MVTIVSVAPQPGQVVRVRSRQYLVEDVAPPPNPGDAWKAGHWEWTNAGWAWKKGTYVTPERPDAVWVPGVWVERDGKWAYCNGDWRAVATR